MKKVIQILVLALVLSACSNSPSDNNVSNENGKTGNQIEELSKEDNKKDSTSVSKENNSVEISEKEDKEKSNKESNKDDSKNDNRKEESKETFTDAYLEHRKTVVKYGEFSKEFADKLSDQKLRKEFDDAKALSEKTGYWDVKDFVLQSLAKQYPNESKKFPLDSIQYVIDNWQKSNSGEFTDKFSDERQAFVERGFVKENLDKIDDKIIEDAFKEAYSKDGSLYWSGYVDKAMDIIERDNPNVSKLQDLDYDRFRSDLKNLYGFKADFSDNLSNRDINIAFARAEEKLKETGFGDIGLALNEIEKMYPDSKVK